MLELYLRTTSVIKAASRFHWFDIVPLHLMMVLTLSYITFLFKLALVLAAIIGLKKLFHQEKYVTYEVVAHPHHEHHHEHSVSGGGGHEGWGRNLDTSAGDLAYRAHKPSA